MATSETKQNRALKRKQNLSVSGDGRSPSEFGPRIVIEGVSPELDGGRFAVKRTVGDIFTVEADIFGEGHDKLAAALLFRRQQDAAWHEAPMQLFDNDRWRGAFPVLETGRYLYSIVAWRDLFASWCDEVAKKREAGQSISLEMVEGKALVEYALAELKSAAADVRRQGAELLEDLRSGDDDSHLDLLLKDKTRQLMQRVGLRNDLSAYPKLLPLRVDRPRAVFSAWYELFPRSQAGDPHRHGTFDDVIDRLPYVSDMGFDVLYLTPIHPIGRTNRKGRNNSLVARPGDPGSPYAIGASEGGHDAINPQLGTLEDFTRLVRAAHDHGLEIALDFAVQCSPDHPWTKEHPEWFDWRPDGSLKYAENPPKKYEDIVNVHFYRQSMPSLWYALRDVMLFWVDQGVKIFRVDNPHTKPFPFWEWLISDVQERHADVIFLSEAFTRPKPMKRLAKIGFTQSYTYFTWRNTKAELTDYLLELTQSGMADYFRPNFFVNTPDINPQYLHTSGKPGFQIRLILAATLAGNYGMYSGFELCEARALPGKEEYADSEKYEIRARDWDSEGSLRAEVSFINRLRKNHSALQQFTNLKFYNAWNDQILYFGKATPDLSDFVLIAVNLDPHNVQTAHFEVPLWEFGLTDSATIGVEDLVTGARFTWTGKVQQMVLDPRNRPYTVWGIAPLDRRSR